MVHYAAAAAALVAIIPAVTAQASAYGQCGGSGWTGTTACVSGYVCAAQNDWYSQCVPGTAGTTTKPPTSTGGSNPPATTGSVDTKERCGQYDSVVAGQYTLYLNQWGISGATGKQCAHLTGLSGNTVSYVTNFQWSGGNGVKTYTNINLNTGLNKQLSAIQSMPSTFTWSFTSSGNVVSDVAYDLFTSSSAGGSNQYEIMIWLANYNAGPISYNYGSDGKPVAIKSNVSLAGHTWNLYYGSNGYNYVYSFLPVSGTVPSFSGDINLFLKYLTANTDLPKNQYLTTFQSGSEPTSGTGTLTVSAYSAAIN